jgi:hypothetical protein
LPYLILYKHGAHQGAQRTTQVVSLLSINLFSLLKLISSIVNSSFLNRVSEVEEILSLPSFSILWGAIVIQDEAVNKINIPINFIFGIAYVK